MRAAVVSDLHLGLASGRDLLRREHVLDALTAAIADADHLVLLGDLVELRERPVARVMHEAAPILRRIGEAAPGARITIVPGNHDHQLVGSPGMVADVLGRERVEIAYPGVWVRPDVYATHGHYLDVHNTVPSFERLAIGAVRRVRRAELPTTVDEYEAAVAPVYRLAFAMAQRSRRRSVAGSQSSVKLWQALNGSGDRLPALAFGAAIGALNRAGLGPLNADLSAIELREAALRGMRTVIERLGIEADHVIFGHTHRSGPHERDSGWGPLMNTGSWIHEPAFLGDDPKSSPYRPGHIVFVGDAGVPELRNVLEEPH
jgi:UDP-2,3-diacylglucosamine pyrophosphatase LpxH